MSTPEHREVSQLLLRKAQEDLGAANVLVATENQADHIIGFHLQQAVEKALKAALVEHAVEIPRTHDLGYLIEVLSKQGVGGADRRQIALADSRELSARRRVPAGRSLGGGRPSVRGRGRRE